MKTMLILLISLMLPLQSPLQRYVDRAVTSETLRGALVGILVRDGDGTVLAEYQSGRQLVPASNLKLITTGTALHALGTDFTFETRLGYRGEVREGTLYGDVYLVGGGDPTLGTRDSIAVKADGLFWRWKTQLKAAGIQRIDGRIIGDGRAFEGHLENPSWEYDDTGTYYGAGTSALSFYANAVDYDVSAGEKPGDAVRITQTYPETPWMHFRSYAFTGPAGTGNSLYLYTTDLAPYAEMRGTFATDRAPKTEHFANKYGALTCAYYFWKNLRATGWEVSGGYADIDRGGYIRKADFVPVEPAGNPVLIGTTRSPELRRIARETNFRSDNFYAESIFRMMGEQASATAVYDSARVAVYDVLRGLGLTPEQGLHMEDGSGLSRRNYLSPRMMVDFLSAMTGSPAYGAFLASLPRPGEGTLKGLMSKASPAVRDRIRVKSGSMDGVLCYSGYILTGDGKPVTVSLMTNSCTAKPSAVREILLRILSLAAEQTAR